MSGDSPVTAMRWWLRVAWCTSYQLPLKQDFALVQNGRDIEAEFSVPWWQWFCLVFPFVLINTLGKVHEKWCSSHNEVHWIFLGRTPWAQCKISALEERFLTPMKELMLANVVKEKTFCINIYQRWYIKKLVLNIPNWTSVKLTVILILSWVTLVKGF